MIGRIGLLGALAALLLAGAAVAHPKPKPDALAESQGSLTTMPASGALARKGAVYVPAYSTVRAGQGKTRIDLAVTLSIHNTSEDQVLVLERIDYYGSAGELLDRHLAQLSKCEMLRNLPSAHMQPLLEHLTERHVAAGEVVFRTGEPGDALYIVASSKVEVLDGDGRALASLGEGQAFGEMALLSAGTRTATVRAESEARCLADTLSRRCWPNDAPDRTDPVALEWVRRWGPSRAPAISLACGCASGRCSVCN